MNEVRPPAAGGLVPSTVALGVVTLVSALSMGRLFSGADWVVPVIVAAIGAHGLAWVLRRLGVTGVAVYLASSSFVIMAVAWLALPHATFYGFPGPGFLGIARDELARALSDFKVVVAPTQATSGFVAAAVLGTSVAALLADWAAFRLRATFEALLPSFTLFLFAAVLGAPAHRELSVSAYLVAVIVYLVVHQAGLDGGRSAWFSSRVRHTGPAVARLAAALGATVVVAALLIAPQVPGFGADPVIAYRNTGDKGPGDRVTVSPLVDIRGRLIDNSNVTVFTVAASDRAYWRLTSLDSFDGRIWSSNGSYRPVKQNIPGGIPAQVPVNKVRQEFAISALASIWLPAAYEPDRIEGVTGASYERDSGSLISKSETSDGLAYTVQSEIPRPRSAQLRTVTNASLPVDVRDRYLDLPAVDAPIVQEARRVVAGKPTPYDQALALQNYFRQGFTYNLNARSGHDERALRQFLFVTKEGYCEQFAGAYAVMARTLGLPARVAVGFTPGDLDPATGRYVVRGVNAHAWPEVFLDGFGWVAFEPTPGRGAPGAEEHTGVTEAQVAPADPNSSVTTPTTVAGEQSPATTEVPGGTAQPAPTIGETPTSRRLPIWGIAVLALAILILVGSAIPAAKHLTRRRRRQRVSAAHERVALAWTESLRALAQAGLAKRPAETALEYSERAGRALPAIAVPLAQLADLLSLTSFASGEPAGAEADAAEAASHGLSEAITGALSFPDRARWILDPRPLWWTEGSRQVITTGRARRGS